MKDRRAYLCSHKACLPPLRVFLQPGDPDPPRCPEHGRTMRLQVNVPYPADKETRGRLMAQAMKAAKPRRKATR